MSDLSKIEKLQYLVEKIFTLIGNDQERKRILKTLSTDEKLDLAERQWLDNISKGEDYLAEGHEEETE